MLPMIQVLYYTDVQKQTATFKAQHENTDNFPIISFKPHNISLKRHTNNNVKH